MMPLTRKLGYLVWLPLGKVVNLELLITTEKFGQSCARYRIMGYSPKHGCLVIGCDWSRGLACLLCSTVNKLNEIGLNTTLI